MGATVWQKCLSSLERELPTQQFSTWIRPLQAESSSSEVRLLAPNQYIRDKVSDNFLERIKELVLANGLSSVSLHIGSSTGILPENAVKRVEKPKENNHFYRLLGLNKEFTFDNFIQGNSNEFARAAAMQVAENVGKSSKCLLLYGGVGLGKTHLMHAVGNSILEKHPHLKVAFTISSINL